MKDSVQLNTETLTKALKLNQAAQQELLIDAADRTDKRIKLLDAFNQARGCVFDAIGGFSDCPTRGNKDRLNDCKQAEIDAETALQEFDARNDFDHMDLLLSSERALKSKLKNIRMHEGRDSLQVEFHQLIEQLKTDLPRLLALNSIIHNVPPGILDVEKFLVKQLNFRRAYEAEYQQLLHELNFEGAAL